MAWIKRNLFFVVGGLVTLVLLGGGGFYIYQELTRNSTASDKLNEIYGTLKSLQEQKPAPGNEKIDNTKIAKEQRQQLEAWIQSAGKFFKPIPSIPPDNITSETFAGALRRTVDLLQHEADAAGVILPPKYDFSFSAQRPLVKFASGSLAPLSVQLGEVKAIAEIVLSARVNALDGIQRVRVSDDDASGSQGDYIDEQPITNNLAIITPYVVTFRSFTPELSRVIGAFATSSNAFVIKAINIQPAGTSGAPSDAQMGTPPGFMPGAMPGQAMPGQMPPPTVAPVTAKGGLTTVLKEQLLRVSMEVELVKLLPKS
jgi:hypothetical protein